MNKNIANRITTTALSTALVCVGTMVIQIPIPLGYMHFGNICIILVASLFSPTTALFAGGVGSAFADLLTGYPQWVIPTLIIKGIMGYAASKVMHKQEEASPVFSLRTIAGSALAIAIMVTGYFVAGSILYGSIYTGAAQIPGLSLEGVCGIVGFYVIGLAMEKAHVSRWVRQIG